MQKLNIRRFYVINFEGRFRTWKGEFGDFHQAQDFTTRNAAAATAEADSRETGQSRMVTEIVSFHTR